VTATVTVGFAGLSHLGLVSGATLASRGVEVVGFDPDAALVGAIERGDLPVVEPGLPELVAAARRPAFTADAAALRRCDVVYVALDVATDDAGHSDLGPLRRLIDVVWPNLAPDATLVILSQVPPGFTRALASERMSAASGQRPAALYYQVETLIFGRAVERALQPERYMVGCADPSQPLPATYAAVLAEFGCPVLAMRYESAELAKISINFFLVSSISTTNMLAELCERVGADWSEISPALRLDARIGAKAYLDPGLGFGGGNLGRDLETVTRLASERGTDTRIIDAWRANSTYRRDWALRLLRAEILPRQPDAVLGVWGLAYKQDTASTKNSPSVALLEALDGRPVSAYDPAAAIPAPLRDRIAAAGDAIDACRGADVLLVMTPWPEFRRVPLDRVAAAMRGRTIVDPNGVIDRKVAAAQGFTHYRLGAPASGGPRG
jgi:UDPglucose 6-dehydrogenase